MSVQDKIALITCIIAAISFASGIVIFLYKLAFRFKQVEDSVKLLKHENVLLIKASFAICDGLHQKGCNGPVTKAREELEQYIIEN